MDEVYTCKKCGHEGPRADFTGANGQLVKRCDRCRDAYRKDKTYDAARPAAPPRGIARVDTTPVQTQAPPIEAPAPAGELITLQLSPSQAEKVLELTFRELLVRKPGMLARSIPGLLDLLVEG